MKRFATLFLLLLTAVSCQQPAVPEQQPEQIVAQSATRMNELAGFHFNIVRDGAPAYVDPPTNTFVFRSAEGDYTPPDRARAVVRVIAGFVTDVRVITVGNIQWQTNPLTNEWEELPPNNGFDPTQLFDSTIGLQTILSEDMSDYSYHGLVTLDEGPNGRFHHISGTLNGERLYQMSNGLIGTYETSNHNYKVLYDKKYNTYIEISNGELKNVISGKLVDQYEEVSNRRKFI